MIEDIYCWVMKKVTGVKDDDTPMGMIIYDDLGKDLERAVKDGNAVAIAPSDSDEDTLENSGFRVVAGDQTDENKDGEIEIWMDQDGNICSRGCSTSK